jgi:hypothetical protein
MKKELEALDSFLKSEVDNKQDLFKVKLDKEAIFKLKEKNLENEQYYALADYMLGIIRAKDIVAKTNYYDDLKDEADFYETKHKVYNNMRINT